MRAVQLAADDSLPRRRSPILNIANCAGNDGAIGERRGAVGTTEQRREENIQGLQHDHTHQNCGSGNLESIFRLARNILDLHARRRKGRWRRPLRAL
jgi:hypothetical protein